MTNQQRIIDILSLLKVKRPKNFNMVRIGRQADGGYVMCDDFKDVKSVISFGIGDEVSFDYALAEMGFTIYQFDHTVEGPPVNHPNFMFHKIAWGLHTSQNSVSLSDLISNNPSVFNDNIILKFDVEGSEWNNLPTVPDEILKKCKIIVAEFHYLNHCFKPEIHNLFKQVFEKLLKNHSVIHLHANNFTSFSIIENVPVPELLEITFYRNDCDQMTEYHGPLPCEIDFPNNPAAPDIILSLGTTVKKDLSNEIFKSSSIDDFLSQISGVIHVGANLGQERDLYNRFGLNVLWIEPIPDVYNHLIKFIDQYPKQKALQALITDQDDAVYKFNVANNNGASSSIFDFKDHKDIWPEISFTNSIELKSLKLSTLIERSNIDVEIYDALILDTQGSELLVLKGCGNRLTNFKYIKLEVADFESYVGCCTLDEIASFMNKNFFREVFRSEFAKRASGGSYFDILYENTAI